jgi:dipeptidyl aminopeptidase/acylaminoacyl peptidase
MTEIRQFAPVSMMMQAPVLRFGRFQTLATPLATSLRKVHFVRLIKPLLASILGLALQLPVMAQSGAAAPEIPVETMFKKATYQGLSFSPDQKFMAARTMLRGRINLVVVDLDKRNAAPLTTYTNADVTGFGWASNDRIFYTTGDMQGFETRGDGGLFAINRDGSNARALVEPVVSSSAMKFVLRLTTVIGRIKNNTEEVIVSANDRSADSQDLYRMNINTGRKSLMTLNSPGKVIRWTLDDDNVARAALSMDAKTRQWWVSYRTSEATPWKTIAKWDENLNGVIIPAAFDPAAKANLYVYSNVGRDTLALFKYDPESGKLGELVYGDDRYDLSTFYLIGDALGEGGRLIFSGKDEEPGKLIGITYSADKPKTVWFDEAARKTQAAIDAALPGTVNTFNVNQRRALVSVRSDVNPGEYYIFDQDKRNIEETGITPRPWINSKQMAPMQPVSWTARDGMRIDGYLTLPLGYKPGQPVPMILHPHGGPWAKDNWGFNPEVQFMANRGFAVLQPNFRGSTGFGAKHLKASYKQWGDTMIDDMIDGVEWAIKQGYADKNKIAVYGASYGGYATLMAMVKRPDMFKWGINYVGVTDMAVHQDTQPAQKFFDFGDLAKVINGDQKADREMFERTSPARHVAQIAAPVFHAYGGEDRNVDFENGRVIKSAFERAGKPFEWMFVADEAHGYRVDENVFEFYKRFDEFAKKYTPKN